ncbi:methyl-accepting chemotaxis protein [Gracilibacillus sp. D59]|uniref:methyl-accepting chemotaxis protein n=1 Tax=Gracilibacillus sp. D59 TaxID=3457434 RepID=UPI003FCE3BC7
MNISKSIKAKLFVSMLLISIIPLLLISSVLYTKTTQGFNTILQNNQSTTQDLITNQLNNVSQDLLELTKSYATNPILLEAFQNGDRKKLGTVVDPIFERLQNEHQLDVFEFGGKDGMVSFRGHNPEKFGDDKNDIPAIQAALNGEETSGFAFGSSGLSVRAFVPLKNGNKVIGSLQTGLSGQVIQSITDSFNGVQLNIMNNEGKILVASDKNNIGNVFKEESILNTVFNGDEVSKENENNLESYSPLYDPTNTEVIGMIQIKQDVGVVKNIDKNIFLYLMIIGISTLIVAIIIAFLLSRSFSKPIKQITTVMGELSKGNLNNKIHGKKRKDEFGQLSNSVIETQSHIKDIIKRISELSQVVNNKSTIMKNACNELKIGSSQVASTMQELAIGSEQQASTSSDSAKKMNQFTARIDLANQNGSSANESSYEVLQITEHGNELMNHSLDEMNKINEIVKEAVQKVEGLDDRSKEIAKLVTVIQEISEQTNLLALNAAIEAARAGEHGKGFAVVADEIRKLSEQVSHSIIEITDIVENIQHESSSVTKSLTKGYYQVEEGSNQLALTGKAFGNIDQAVSDMSSKIQNISSTLTDITTNSRDINSSIEHMSSISQESAAGIEEVSASVQQTDTSVEELSNNADSLEKLSSELEVMVKKFQL